MTNLLSHFTWKNISLHTLFWLFMIFIINTDLLNLEWGPFIHSEGTLLIPSIYGMVINLFLFYLNTVVLIPKYIDEKKIVKFWTVSLIWIVSLSFFEFILDIIYTLLTDESIDNTGDIGQGRVALELSVFFLLTMLINAFCWGLAFLYRLPSYWVRNERIKGQLIKDKLTSELEFLKSQINPHFLFNGINSIYHLIGYDDKAARDVLLRFSGLLRYQLYECNEEFIPISKELDYIKNYLKMEEVRKGEDAVFDIDIPLEELEASSLRIAPLIFTPFLENAFKYLSMHTEKEKNKLEVSISIANGALDFRVENTINKELAKRQESGSGGIGLENVKRRLSLLYPERHQLYTKEGGSRFVAQLKLKLN
jgi:two-component system LytT family sensor kinase